jgi:hypothetical protein
MNTIIKIVMMVLQNESGLFHLRNKEGGYSSPQEFGDIVLPLYKIIINSHYAEMRIVLN